MFGMNLHHHNALMNQFYEWSKNSRNLLNETIELQNYSKLIDLKRVILLS